MELTRQIWAFVITLAAVINGLGIVQLVKGFGYYLKNHSVINVRHYWVYTLLAVFQLLAHLLLWWSILGVTRTVEHINFLTYLYIITGPTLLYLGTSVIVPELKDASIDLRKEYFNFRKTFFSIMAAFWLWVMFVWPVLGHKFPPTISLLIAWLFISLVLRFTDNLKIHAVLALANLIVYAAFIVLFAMQAGGVSSSVIG